MSEIKDSVTTNFYDFQWLVKAYKEYPDAVIEWIQKMHLPYTKEEIEKGKRNAENGN